MKWNRDRKEEGKRMHGGGEQRNGFLHTYLHGT